MGKVKEIKRTANVAWSPRSIQSIYLAAGTVAQQLDASFSTTASLEIFRLDLSSSEHEMPLVGSIETRQRFHKLLWSGYGLDEGQYPMGVVIGGSDNGKITVWDVDKIAKSDGEGALVTSLDQHVGAVRTLDVNPFQSNLIASGAGESEVFIWDLNNPASAMSPGNKLHPLEDISGVAWNRQVQHILASTSPNGRSVVWDLRKNEPIIQVSDSNSRIRCKAIAWHPEVATQLVTGSEDDRSPVVQMWDLRYATAPLRILERHQRGVLSLAWCPQDADLLLSAAKDNRVYCWNPNADIPGGEVVYELPATAQWIFECQWCPRNPAIISTSSFDGHVSLYSLLGGGGGANKSAETPLVDSSDPFSAIAAQKVKEVETAPLKTPPKWFRRPCGARFGFGGQLVSFTSTAPSRVVLSQIVTEPQLVKQSEQFEQAMSQQSYLEYCSQKISSTATQHEQIWNFLKATFEAEPRRHYLKLLGFSPEELTKQVESWVESSSKATPPPGESEEWDVATLPVSSGQEGETAALFSADDPPASPFDEIVREATPPKESLSFTTESDDPDGLLTRALLVGNFKAAVDICISVNRMSEALILSVAGGSELFQSTQKRFFDSNESSSTKLISLITSRNWSEIARYGNLDDWREILAALVTYATNEEFTRLCDVLGGRLEDEGGDGCYDNAALCYVCSGNVNKFVDCCLRSHDMVGDPLVLQDLIEKVTLLRQAIKMKHKELAPINKSSLSDQLSSYSTLLASQGLLQTALVYLEQTNSAQSIPDVAVLHDRLSQCLRGMGNSPHFPFEQVNVTPSVPTATPTTMASTSYVSTHRPKPIEDPATVAKGPSPSSSQHNDHLGYSNHVGGAYVNQPYHQVPPVRPLPGLVPHPPPSDVNMYAPPPDANVYAPPPSHAPPTRAWNDPPSLRHAKKTTSKYVAAPSPLTAPLAAVTTEQTPPTAPPTEHTQPVMPPQPPSPVTPLETQPIPTEHAILYTVFNGLLTQCKSRANNKVMGRKVDEIGRKLDVLYDLIRQSRLTHDTLQGLHAIAQDVQGMNYVGGLARLNHMVATSNLSEISSFMPGIKTLLQLGMQLKL